VLKDDCDNSAYSLNGLESAPVNDSEMVYPLPFFSFPFRWLWTNSLSILKFQANAYCSSSQIHVIQDFSISTESENETQTVDLHNSFVCVYLCNLKFENNSKMVMGICSVCDTNGDLIK
jgi:hypothetical protein